MSLAIFVAVVVIGIVVIVATVHLSGLSRHEPLDSGTARAAWSAEHPDAEIARVVLSDDGRAALLRLLDGGRGLVWTFGADVVTRILDERTTITSREDRLIIDFHDAALPRLTLPFADVRAQNDWTAPTAMAAE